MTVAEKPAEPKFRAKNGERLMVRFHNYAGMAGIQIRKVGGQDRKYAAFTPTSHVGVGNVGIIDGRDHLIRSFQRSRSVTGMIVVEVEDIHDASEIEKATAIRSNVVNTSGS